MSLNIAFIGAGNINRIHMDSARRLGLTLAAVADVSDKAREEARKTFGIAKAYQDYRQMLADRDIEAVVIGTPNSLHAEHAVAALHAGKHVLLEKPMACTVEECDQIIVARQRSGKVLQMGMINRFRSSTQALRDFVRAGKCGDIYSGQTFWYRRRGIPAFGSWFTRKSVSGGGCLIDLGVHMVDLALYLWDFPTPVAVSGMVHNIWPSLDDYRYNEMWGRPTPGGRKDVEDYAVGLVRFADGQTLQVNISWALNAQIDPAMGLRLMGNQGGIALHGFDEPHFFGEDAGHLVDTRPLVKACEPALEEMRHFAECIREGREPMATAEQARMVQSILCGIYRSARERREVRLDAPRPLIPSRSKRAAALAVEGRAARRDWVNPSRSIARCTMPTD